MEMLLFFILLAAVYAGSRVAVDYYFLKKRSNAWKEPSPLLGVVKPETKSQKDEEQK